MGRSVPGGIKLIPTIIIEILGAQLTDAGAAKRVCNGSIRNFLDPRDLFGVETSLCFGCGGARFSKLGIKVGYPLINQQSAIIGTSAAPGNVNTLLRFELEYSTIRGHGLQ